MTIQNSINNMTLNDLNHVSIADLLQFCLDNGMFNNADEAAEKIVMEKRREILSNHPYNIWQGKTNKNWYTYLPDRRHGRKLVQRKKRESVEQAIIEYYENLTENPSVEDLFYDWINLKVSRQEICLRTKERYTRDFEKYFEPIRSRPIKSLTEFDIEDFVIRAINQYHLTSKAYGNIRTVLYGTFKLAKKKGIISYSITGIVHDFDIPKKSFSKPKRDKDKEILTEPELTALRGQLGREGASIKELGVYLLTYTGLRIGELAALQLRDIDLKRQTIHVCRTEISYEREDGKRVYEVRDFPKTEAGIRDVYVSEECCRILARIRRENPFGEYLFELKGKRLRTYQFRQTLYNDCKIVGIPKKPPHSLRRTYASMLLDAGLPEAFIIAQMGHTRIDTTKIYYYKDRATDAEKHELINRVSGLVAGF